VLPRVLALAVAGFTLGVIFLVVAVASGWLAAELLGLLRGSRVDLLDNIVAATAPWDFAILALKLTLAGALVALTSAITGMSATPRDTPSYLLPRGFVRGLTAVLLTSVVLTVTLT
jgi:phospholipid/cholesterol/gamma-HCH transport system permease protein